MLFRWRFIDATDFVEVYHCIKTVSIRSYSGPYSVRMRENTDQNDSEYGHFSRSEQIRL